MVHIGTIASRGILWAPIVMGMMVLGLSASAHATNLHISLTSDLSSAAMLGASQKTVDFFISPHGY